MPTLNRASSLGKTACTRQKLTAVRKMGIKDLSNPTQKVSELRSASVPSFSAQPLNGFYYVGVCTGEVDIWDGTWWEDHRASWSLSVSLSPALSVVPIPYTPSFRTQANFKMIDMHARETCMHMCVYMCVSKFTHVCDTFPHVQLVGNTLGNIQRRTL